MGFVGSGLWCRAGPGLFVWVRHGCSFGGWLRVVHPWVLWVRVCGVGFVVLGWARGVGLGLDAVALQDTIGGLDQVTWCHSQGLSCVFQSTWSCLFICVRACMATTRAWGRHSTSDLRAESRCLVNRVYDKRDRLGPVFISELRTSAVHGDCSCLA